LKKRLLDAIMKKRIILVFILVERKDGMHRCPATGPCNFYLSGVYAYPLKNGKYEKTEIC